MPKNIAVLVTHHFEDIHYDKTVEAFRAARHSILNIEAQAGKIIHGQHYTTAVTIDQSIAEVDLHNFDALLIPGGHSHDPLSQDQRYLEFIQYFAQSNKLIMSISNGPQLLIQAQVVAGRLMTINKPNVESLINAGAVYYDVSVVNDNNLYISSPSSTDLPYFIRESLIALSQ
ncbi:MULTISPECIES: DJ-1/PfpI family protein [Acinetobacter]|uniref:Peptidase n=1 Tax=Acinetobacter chengduensis TaxID=2420890 RepID=A0ABX9TUZ3_9GAMM|nr:MULTISPECIES: DJ-1/PfpI family protein [Acinetobacter]MBI1453025.1 DJ-1/PfpI family protein [Acinetobacter sp. FL51]RKG41362.1 peptidase [Acinetobacter sp. WCHAc060007]RLL20372.1 peptidase [Acinetobacter chengduensis]